MTNQLWFHIDINSYFASILQQEIPSLRGKPLGVVKDLGRTCLIATSREAKQYGIKTGISLKDARVLYPKITILPAAFHLYLSATQKLERVLRSFTPDVEVFSLDEAFLLYSPIERHFTSPEEAARSIQESIKQSLGEWVTCSVGIAENKFLAKLAGELCPTDQILHVTEKNKDLLLASARFKDVCGVGLRLEKKLQTLGVTNPYAIRFIPQETLEKVVGFFWAEELKKIAYGEETHFLSHTRKVPYMQSVSRSITCMKAPWSTDEQLRSVLYNLTLDISYKARLLKLSGRNFSVSFTGRNEYWKTAQTFTAPLSHGTDTAQLIWETVQKSWKDTFPVVRCRVSLNLLSPHTFSQEGLLPGWQRTEKIEAALLKINKKYGDHMVRPAVLLSRSQLLKPEVTGFFGDKEFYALSST